MAAVPLVLHLWPNADYGYCRDELYYLDDDGDLAAIRLVLGDRVVIDAPQKLFPAPVDLAWANLSDGERFILGTSGMIDEDPITLILSWDSGTD